MWSAVDMIIAGSVFSFAMSVNNKGFILTSGIHLFISFYMTMVQFCIFFNHTCLLQTLWRVACCGYCIHLEWLLSSFCCLRNHIDLWDWINQSPSCCIQIFYSLTYCVFLGPYMRTSSGRQDSAVSLFIFCFCMLLQAQYRLRTTACRHTRQRNEIPLSTIRVIPLRESPSYTYECDWCSQDPSVECIKCVCAICQTSMDKTECTQRNWCPHAFHLSCWNQYQLTKSMYAHCPICRQN